MNFLKIFDHIAIAIPDTEGTWLGKGSLAFVHE